MLIVNKKVISDKENINEPSVIGSSIRNTNSDAFFFSIPIHLLPKYVLPLLDIPGIIPSTWNNHIPNAILLFNYLFLKGIKYIA